MGVLQGFINRVVRVLAQVGDGNPFRFEVTLLFLTDEFRVASE